MKINEKYIPKHLTFGFQFCIFVMSSGKTITKLFSVIQTTEGRKDLGCIQVDVHEILHYASLRSE